MSEKLICDKCGEQITDEDYLHVMVERMTATEGQYPRGSPSVAFLDYHLGCIDGVVLSRDIPSQCKSRGNTV